MKVTLAVLCCFSLLSGESNSRRLEKNFFEERWAMAACLVHPWNTNWSWQQLKRSWFWGVCENVDEPQGIYCGDIAVLRSSSSLLESYMVLEMPHNTSRKWIILKFCVSLAILESITSFIIFLKSMKNLYFIVSVSSWFYKTCFSIYFYLLLSNKP